MNKFILFLLLFQNNLAFCQPLNEDCPKGCEKSDEKDKYQFFASFDTSQKRLIKNNWKQYFKEDVFGVLDTSISYYPLFFDSYGSLYPDFDLIKDADSDFFVSPIYKDKNIEKYSFYEMFNAERNKILLTKNLNQIGNLHPKLKEFYITLLNQPKIKDDSIFCSKWNKIHDDLNVLEINAKLKNKKKIIFFIHGYNVPYSLAAIQASKLIDEMSKKYSLKKDELLLIPVFWSSNDQKHCRLSSLEDFDVKDEKKPINADKFTYYSNRAYFAGIGLRRIINKLEINSEKEEVYIFAHSLGCTVATTALINTTSKLQISKKWHRLIDSFKLIYKSNFITPFLKSKYGAELKKEDTIAYNFLTEFNNEPIPDLKIKIFLSAAAIPGVSTFIDRDLERTKNHYYYVGINRYDQMLNKRFIIFKIIPLKFGSRIAGNTSLGQNKSKDAESSRALFAEGSHFQYKCLSNKRDHDIFCYLQQKSYLDYVGLFFTK